MIRSQHPGRGQRGALVGAWWGQGDPGPTFYLFPDAPGFVAVSCCGRTTRIEQGDVDVTTSGLTNCHSGKCGRPIGTRTATGHRENLGGVVVLGRPQGYCHCLHVQIDMSGSRHAGSGPTPCWQRFQCRRSGTRAARVWVHRLGLM